MTKAIILLAGKGSRLKNYTDNNHKALIKFNKMNFSSINKCFKLF